MTDISITPADCESIKVVDSVIEKAVVETMVVDAISGSILLRAELIDSVPGPDITCKIVTVEITGGTYTAVLAEVVAGGSPVIQDALDQMATSLVQDFYNDLIPASDVKILNVDFRIIIDRSIGVPG